jgi:hypothetical protein
MESGDTDGLIDLRALSISSKLRALTVGLSVIVSDNFRDRMGIIAASLQRDVMSAQE